MTKFIFPLILILSLAFFMQSAEAKFVEEHIFIVPVGDVDAKIIKYIEKNLPDCFPMSVNVGVEEVKEIPPVAYNPSRKQYNADVMLDDVASKVTVDLRNERALVVVDVDLYTLDTDYVLELADAKRGICIISLARLREEFYGKEPNLKALTNRAVKESAGILTRSWDIPACSNYRCVNYSSDKMTDIDKKRNTFCHECSNRLYNHYDSPLFKFKL